MLPQDVIWNSLEPPRTTTEPARKSLEPSPNHTVGEKQKVNHSAQTKGIPKEIAGKEIEKKEIYCTLGISGRPITLQSSRVVQLSCVTMFAVLRGLDQSNHLKIGQACRNLWKSVEFFGNLWKVIVILSWGLEEALHSSLQLISQGRLYSGLELDQGIGFFV